MKHQSNSSIVRRVQGAALAALVIFQGSSPLIAQSQTSAARDFRIHPPKVASLTLDAAPGTPGSKILKVRFAESGLPSTLTISYQGAKRTLRDDGVAPDAAADGVYSVVVNPEPAAARSAVTSALAASAFNPAPPWEVGTSYVVGTLVSHLGLTYKCLQSHRAQSDWEPQHVPALWAPQDDGGLDPEKTLMIRDVSVVNSNRTSDPCLTNDPNQANRKWTFGYLMNQIANTPQTGRTGSDIALSLLRQWETNQTINGELVPARPAIRQRITDKWLRASGNTGRLAMHKAPFRLLAIVNRVDLRQNLFFGEGLAGEMRFVWGVVDLENVDADGTCQQDFNFTFIMEYSVDRRDAAAVKAWGQRWVSLNALTLDTEAFRTSLQNITESVVRAGVGAPAGRANGSALIRIRTNEISLSSPWELRELEIAKAPSPRAGLFVETNVKQTPANALNRSPQFAKYVNDNTPAILAETFNVPLQFDGAPFRGGSSLNNIDFWNAPGIANPRARHIASINTCNGCHGAETATGFLHVFPRSRALPAFLSGFLTGTDVFDPTDFTVRRHMNDLHRRAVDLRQLTATATLSQLSFQPLHRTH